jgi:hypothetical protein
MAKNESAAGPPGKLAGKAVAFVGKFGHAIFGPAREFMASLVEQEGGTVVDGLRVAPDYVVEGKGVGSKPPSAIAKIQKKHPGMAVIDADVKGRLDAQSGAFSTLCGFKGGRHRRRREKPDQQ